MTQQEFEQRLGTAVSASQFEAANKMYMACSLDKDKFVHEYKLFSLHSSDFVAEIVMEIEQLRNRVRTISNELIDLHQTLQSERLDFGRFLTKNSEIASEADIRAKAIEMLGVKKYLTSKIDLGLSFSDEDNQLILSICKE